jgi:hypothetical protein
VLVGFEGPDWYAWRGGLAERMVALATHLADRGAETHYYFFGDPGLPGEERISNVPLVLHRWAQWLCAGHPGGAYDGEEAKWRELARSLPDRVLGEIILPALAVEVTPVVLAEEWQTVPWLLALADRLEQLGLAQQVELLWRCGSLDRTAGIDWPSLRQRARITVTTPELRDALAIEGIPAAVLSPQPASLSALLDARPDPLPRPAMGVTPVQHRRPGRGHPGRRVPTTDR